MSLEQVILHIGTGKTGTTSIQYFLLTNRDLLLRHRYLVQIPGDFLELMTPRGIDWFSDEALELGIVAIQRELERTGATRLLWSWEALSNRVFSERVGHLRRIKETFRSTSFRIIVYLRRQDHWLRSAYLQWGIKDNQEEGPILSFVEWYERLRQGRLRWWRPEDLNYWELLAPWVEVFGRESLVVRVYERDELTGNSAVPDFREHSGLPKDVEFAVDIEEVNHTLNMELHDLIAMYRALTGEKDTPIDLLYYVDEMARDPFFRSPGFSRFDYSPSIAAALLQDCEPSNQAVARSLLGREDGVLFREPWPSPHDPEPQVRGLTLETAVPMLVQLIMREHQRTTYFEQRYNELVGQMRTLEDRLCALEIERQERAEQDRRRRSRTGLSRAVANLRMSLGSRSFRR